MNPRPSKTSRNGSREADGGRGQAEALAIAALSFLAEDSERLGTFLALSGLGPDSLRASAGDPHFLAGVLDHLVSDERLLLDFAEHQGLDPFEITRARMLLAGAHQDST